MTTRLNKTNRAEIRRKLIAKRFDPERQLIANESDALFHKIVDAWLGEHKAAVEALPEGFMLMAQSLRLGRRDSDRRTKYYRVEGHAPRRVPAEQNTGWESVESDALPPALRAEIEVFKDRIDAFDKAEETARAEIDKVLNSVQTTTRLYEIWPELVEVVPVVEGAAQGKWMLPDMSKLNKLLGLGEKKDAAPPAKKTRARR